MDLPTPSTPDTSAGFPVPNDVGFTPTRITISGVPLDVTNFTWELSPGVAAYTLMLNTFPITSTKLERLGAGPHRVEIEAMSGTLGMQRLTVEHVYLRDDRVADEATLSWRVSDRRVWLDYNKFTGHFNLRRKVNDQVGLDPTALFAFSVEAYRPYSAHVSIDKNGVERRTPWTALGAIRHVLNTVDPNGLDAKTFELVEDNGVPIESRSYYEERASSILPELMRLAEVSMYVSLTGHYRFFSKMLPSEAHAVWSKSGITRGRLRVQRNHRTRPSSITVWFKQEVERYAEFIEISDVAAGAAYTKEQAATRFEKLAEEAGIRLLQSGAEAAKDAPRGGAQQGAAPVPPGVMLNIDVNSSFGDVAAALEKAAEGAPEKAAAFAALIAAIANAANAQKRVFNPNDPIVLENVLQLPRNLTVTVDGLGTVAFTRGEWVPVDLALAAWQLLDANSTNKPLLYLTKENLRRYWFNNLIGRVYTFNRAYPTWVDPERAERVQVVRDAYRRTFRITKPWLDNIHDWDASRVTIVDPITRTRALPFISTQYCEVPNLRPPVLAARGARVAAENVDDYSTTKQSPFIFSSVDRDMGILQVQPMRDLTDVVRERIRGQVDNIPKYDLNPDGSILWQNASLSADYKLRVVLTVEWGAPNNKSRLYPVQFNLMGQGGQGGHLDCYTMVDTARVDVDGNVVNADLVRRIASLETRLVMFSHRDLGLGFVHLTGLRETVVPQGACRSVSFVVDNGFAYTMYDITEPYTGRPAAALMDPVLRHAALRIAEVR